MQFIDWLIVVLSLLFLLWLGFRLAGKASVSMDEFILADRKMPWWLAGMSMAATNLNASGMLQDSRKIRQDGLSGLWFTWMGIFNFSVGTVWFFRLWRRAGFTTQMEFYQARYAGWRADFARLFDTLFYGIGLGSMWAAIGLVGMKKVVSVVLDLPATVTWLGWSVPTDTLVVLVLVAVALTYSASSGVHGVVWTDVFEFLLAMGCSVGLALLVFDDVGWNTGLRDRLVGLGAEGERLLKLAPTFGPVLVYFLFVDPVLTQGGYNPHVQRYLALKNERDVIYMMLFSNLVNYVFKPMPFYICGLAGIFLFSDERIASELGLIVSSAGETIPDYERVFPALVEHYLPVGILGLMITGFMCAFMSSFAPNIHNATSVFTNDLYRAYVAKGRTERHYVQASRVFMVFQTIVASVVGIVVQDILGLFMAALAMMASPGIVKLARFLWWRVNGWGELAAQAMSVIGVAVMMSAWGQTKVVEVMRALNLSGNDGFFVTRQLLLIAGSSLVALVVVLLTQPEPRDHLAAFYRRVRPFGWWEPVIAVAGEEHRNRESRGALVLLTLMLITTVLASIFAALGLMLAWWSLCVPALLVAAAALFSCLALVKRLYPNMDYAGRTIGGQDSPPAAG